MHCSFLISALLLVSQMIMGADAQLQFNPTSILIQPKIDEVSGTYICKVTNTTHAPVVITDVKGGCGCIRHLLGSKMLAAGASTDLTIMFDFGDYVGLQKRKIVLITKSEGQEQAIRNELPMTGEILTPLSFSTKAAIWLYGDRPSEKEIKIQIKKEYVLKALHVEDPLANHFINVVSTFDASSQTLSLKINPTSTDITVVSPTEKANLQVPYLVKYTLPSGIQRYEKIWVTIAKRPEEKPNAGKQVDEAKSPAMGK